MGIREKLNDNPGITTGVTAAIIIIALGLIIWQATGNSGPSIPTKAYYSIDDGATYFADDINLIPPFEKDGKPAYLAMVFQCDGGKPFVSYLQRYTKDAKAKLEAAKNKPPAEGGDMMIYEEVRMNGTEVKKPGTGDTGWVKQADYQRSSEITSPKCPDGTTNNLEPVYP